MIFRYSQSDPIGVSVVEANLFRYAANNPTGKQDPLGLVTIDKSCDCNSPIGNVPRAVANACSYLKRPSCQAAMRLIRVHPANSEPAAMQGMLGCMNDRCSNTTPWTVSCGTRTDISGDTQGVFTFLHVGDRSSPRFTENPPAGARDYGQTLFHELMHTCGRPPHGGQYSSSPWKEIETACTGWPK